MMTPFAGGDMLGMPVPCDGPPLQAPRRATATRSWWRRGAPALASALAVACSAPPPQPQPGAEAFYKQLQEQLLAAEPGDVVEIPEGHHELTRTLTLRGRSGVTLRGAGMDRTILDFASQRVGAEGLRVSGVGDFQIEGLTIRDTRGDALRIEKSARITIRDVKTEWSRGPHEDNGAYGIYPVQCQDVLIDGAVAIGASDAGLYVGQSTRVVIRNSRAERNVAGIEIENTTFADVHDNLATGNTGGILVFDLPDLPVQGGRSVRIFDNRVIANDEPNFAPAGNIVAKVPTGTGIMVMANDEVEIFGNEIRDNGTTSVAIVSYFVTEEAILDARYDPWPERVHVHDNRISGGGGDPAGGSSFQSKKLVLALRYALGTPLPDILWDGIAPPDRAPRICLRNNAGASFADADADNDFASVSRDTGPFDCSLPALEAVVLEGRESGEAARPPG
jgi:parallel beta-helix repeat protein